MVASSSPGQARLALAAVGRGIGREEVETGFNAKTQPSEAAIVSGEGLNHGWHG